MVVLKYVLKISAIALAALAVYLVAPSADGAIIPSCPGLVSVIQGPIETTGDGYVYTLDPGEVKEIPGSQCTWTIGAETRGPEQCAAFTHTISKDKGGIQVHVEIDAGGKKCQSWDEKNLIIKPGEKHKIIARSLELDYPTLKDVNGKELYITSGTTIAEIVRYFFVLALTALGLIALGSLLWSSGAWALGSKDAFKRMGGVLIGGALLLSVYVVLNFINPELLVLKDPNIPNISVEIPEIPFITLEDCQDAKRDGIALRCKNFTKYDWEGCVFGTKVGICSEMIVDGPCNWESALGAFEGHCFSYKTKCEGIDSCSDYKIDALDFYDDTQNACNRDVCGKSADGCEVVNKKCVAPRSGSGGSCTYGKVEKCSDYPPAGCNTNACGTATDAPCIRDGQTLLSPGMCTTIQNFCSKYDIHNSCADYQKSGASAQMQYACGNNVFKVCGGGCLYFPSSGAGTSSRCLNKQ